VVPIGYGDKVTKSIAGRMFSMVFMAFGVLLVACFTATFTATLTVRDLQTDVSGVADLPGKKVVTVRGTTGASYLKDRSIPATEVDSVDEMLRQLRAGEVDAAVYDGPVLTYEAKPESGGRIRRGPITREYYGIAEPHDSPLGQDIDVALLTVYEDGTYNRLYDTWFESS
jgi:polar amino acid transport system substrate-binding protein